MGYSGSTKYWPEGCSVWVGKLCRQKATYLARERLKAAVKVNLPINMSYAEVLLLTNISVQIMQDFSSTENQGRVKSAGQLRPLPCDGKVDSKSCPLLKKRQTTWSPKHFENLNSSMIPSKTPLVGDFGHAESKPLVYLGRTINYCFTGLWASSAPSWGLAICCPNSRQFLLVLHMTQSFGGRIRQSDFAGYKPLQKCNTPQKWL